MSKTILVSLEDRYGSDDDEFVIPLVFKNTDVDEQCLFEIIDRGDLNEVYLLISTLFAHTANVIGIRQITRGDQNMSSYPCVAYEDNEPFRAFDSFEREDRLFPHEGHDEDEYEQEDYEEDSNEDR
jgi:hypothetical protein